MDYSYKSIISLLDDSLRQSIHPLLLQDLKYHTISWIYIIREVCTVQHPSNRSLAYCTLLDVLWQMCHAWITYAMLRRTILLISKSYEANDGQQETPHSACL